MGAGGGGAKEGKSASSVAPHYKQGGGGRGGKEGLPLKGTSSVYSIVVFKSIISTLQRGFFPGKHTTKV